MNTGHGLIGTACGAVLLCCLLDTEAVLAQSVIRGPYLQSGTPTEITVRWRTDSAGDSAVYFGTQSDDLTESVVVDGQATEHTVAITGLSPGTRYYYAVGTSSSAIRKAEATHHFVTAPLEARPTRVWVVGDSGTSDVNARAVREAYKRYTGSRGADMLLMLGDNAYENGTDDEYQAAVFYTYPVILRQMVLWPTLGNHDGHRADSVTQTGPYYEIFDLGQTSLVPSGTEAYYSFDYGNIHFVCLESYETGSVFRDAMLNWLEDDLIAARENGQQWIIAFWHHPPYSDGFHKSDTEAQLVWMRENALPILEAHEVDLVLAGHSHSYERSFLLHGHYGTSSTLGLEMLVDETSGRESRDTGVGAYDKMTAGAPGAVYVVAGSSGKVTSGQTLGHPAMFTSFELLGSVLLDIDGPRLDALFLDRDGAVHDSFTLLKGPDNTPPRVESVDVLDPTTVRVGFSPLVNADSAGNFANYTIDDTNVEVSSASLEADARTVILELASPLTPQEPHTLTVTDVKDLLGNQMPQATTMPFVLEDGPSHVGALNATLLTKGRKWKYGSVDVSVLRNGLAVPNALVTGQWSGDVIATSTVAAAADVTGHVSFGTERLPSDSAGELRFAVTDIVTDIAGDYDPALNVRSSACLLMPSGLPCEGDGGGEPPGGEPDTMSVTELDVALGAIGKSKWSKGTALATVVLNDLGSPVSGASVVGQWTLDEVPLGTTTAVTSDDGVATLESDKFDGAEQVCFTVTAVAHTSYAFDGQQKEQCFPET